MATLITLTAQCYDCGIDVEVYGYSNGVEDGVEQWDLIEPDDSTGPSHLTHDVYIIGPS